MPSKKKKPRLAPSEVEIMTTIWDRGAATVAEVVAAVNEKRCSHGGSETLARNTLLKGMQRLEEKGWLVRVNTTRPAKYSATEDKEHTVSEMAKEFSDRVFGGSPVSMVRSLLGGTELTEAEAAELQSMINSASKKKGKKQ